MKFRLITLVDITETGARFNKNDPAWHQQQNFITVMQTIGLRVNIHYDHAPEVSKTQVKDLGFGSQFKGSQKVWTFEFATDFENALDMDMLMSDFDIIPIITGLEESAKFENPVFKTADPAQKNIIFINCSD